MGIFDIIDDYLAKKMQGDKQPDYATGQRWKDIDEENKKNYPCLFFIQQFLQEVDINLSWFIRILYINPKDYLYNRFIAKNFLVKLNIGKGDYCDHDTRLLYAVMQIMVEYVQDRQRLYGDTSKDFDISKVFWELEDNDNTKDVPEHQRNCAKVTKEAYFWWMNYENREKEIADAWTTVSKSKFLDIKNFLDNIKNPEEQKLADIAYQLEVELNLEEGRHLKNIIEVKDSLWV